MSKARIFAGVVLSGLGLLVVLGAATPRGRSAPPPPPPPPPQVELTLTTVAPDYGWTLKLTNTGTDPVRIVADPRLFSFDVTNAGHEQHCTLPADMTPTTDTERTLVVPAGRSWSQRVEPLLYCFNAAQSAALAPGATVVANFGWTAARYAPPFAVTPTTLTDGGIGPARRISAPVVTLAAAQQPQDAGATFADAAVTLNPPDAYPVKIKTSLPARLDVSRAYEQTVTVTITNEGDRPVRTLLTPPVIGFVVERPDGQRVRCGAETPVTALAELVSTLGPRGRSAQSIDIGALCGAFMRAPGLYRVQPRLDTRRVAPPPGWTTFWRGESIGTPMLMRVRNGEETPPPPRLDRGP